MQRNRLAVLMAALSVLLLVPSAVVAHTVTMLGSLKIEGATASDDLTGKLVGFAVISNPGLEKTITQPIPPFTLPVFVDGEKDDEGEASTQSGGKPFLHKRFETTVVLTNTSGGPLTVVLKVRDALGNLLGTQTHDLVADQTVLVQLSNLVP